jgi:hypothetical protein
MTSIPQFWSELFCIEPIDVGLIGTAEEVCEIICESD